MGIGTILICVALIIVVGILVGAPLFEKRRPAIPTPSRRETLELEHHSIVRAIRDLDLDFKTHKITEEDYQVLRIAQVERGSEVLRILDQMDKTQDIDSEIESAISVLRNAASQCTRCHAQVRADDRFCPQCGYALHATHVAEKPKV